MGVVGAVLAITGTAFTVRYGIGTSENCLFELCQRILRTIIFFK